jgi:hypothetical protein
VKTPQRRVAIAALLLAPTLTACGFSVQTDQVYQAAVGVNDRSGQVHILNALIVSDEDGSGTFAGTLVNKSTTEDDRLESVTGEGITASRRTIEIPAGGIATLAESGDVTLTGDAIEPGVFVTLTFAFSDGDSVTVSMPVVAAEGGYADVPMPSASSSADDE